MELTVLIFHGDCPAAAALLDERNRDLSLPLDEPRAQMRATNPDSIFVPYACLPEMRRGAIACVLREIVGPLGITGKPAAAAFMEPSRYTLSVRTLGGTTASMS